MTSKLEPLIENHATLDKIVERVIQENTDAEVIEELAGKVELYHVRLNNRITTLITESK